MNHDDITSDMEFKTSLRIEPSTTYATNSHDHQECLIRRVACVLSLGSARLIISMPSLCPASQASPLFVSLLLALLEEAVPR